MVYPGKADGVELADVDAVGMECGEVALLQGLVVGVVAEAVEGGSYLYTLFAFLPEDVEEQRGDGVVTEIEVLQMHTLLGLTDILKEPLKLLPTRHEQFHFVVIGEMNAQCAHLLNGHGIAGLCRRREK